MDRVNKTVRNFGKGKTNPSDEPPPYSAVAPSVPEPALPKQNSLDQKPKHQLTEEEPASASSKPKSKKMPRDADTDVEERRPRNKGKKQAASDSEDSGFEDMKRSKQLVVRDEKKVAKREKSSKKKRRGDDSDSEEEMIVTKTVRRKVLDFDDLDEGFVRLMCQAFEVQPNKVMKWCEADKIKWDNQNNEYDVSKVLDGQEDDDVKFFKKAYKKDKDLWQQPSEKVESSRRPRGRSDTYIIDDRPVFLSPRRPGYDPRYNAWCDNCHGYGVYCGDPYHEGLY